MHKAEKKLEVTIAEADALMRKGELYTSDEPEHQGRNGDFWPIYWKGHLLQTNNITAKVGYPSLYTRMFLKDNRVNIGAAQRFGICLTGWIKNSREEKTRLALISFCKNLDIPQDDDGNYVIKLALNGDQEEG